MASILDRPQGTAAQFVRYVFVGGAAAAVDTGTLVTLNSRLGVRPLVAAAAGFVLGLLVNYFASIALVFESRGRMTDELALFALIGAGGLLLTELILWAAIELAGWPVLAAKIVALALVLVWNFALRKKFVFGLAR